MKRLAFVVLLCGVWRLSAQDAEPMPKVETPAERAERIITDAGEVAKNLEQRDPNAATLEKQKQILKDLEELLKQPPPPPMQSSSSSSNSPSNSKSSSDQSKSNSPMPQGGNSGGSPMPMPMGGNSGGSPMPMPMGGSGGGEKESPSPMSRREKRLQQQQQQAKADPKMGMGQQPMPMPMQGDPMTKQGGEPKKNGVMGKGSDMAKAGPMGSGPMGNAPMSNQPMGLSNDPKSPPPPDQANRLADLSKGVWGHLPETMRQELDLYYRDRFMPRYSDLLREYYSSIAEGERSRR